VNTCHSVNRTRSNQNYRVNPENTYVELDNFVASMFPGVKQESGAYADLAPKESSPALPVLMLIANCISISGKLCRSVYDDGQSARTRTKSVDLSCVWIGLCFPAGSDSGDRGDGVAGRSPGTAFGTRRLFGSQRYGHSDHSSGPVIRPTRAGAGTPYAHDRLAPGERAGRYPGGSVRGILPIATGQLLNIPPDATFQGCATGAVEIDGVLIHLLSAEALLEATEERIITDFAAMSQTRLLQLSPLARAGETS
jgi:hypothetical protein